MSEYLCWNRKLRIIRYPGDIINLSMDTNKNNHHIMKEDIQQYRVNETAVEIMRLVNGKNTYDDIVAALCDKYKEEEASVQKKLNSFLETISNQYGLKVVTQNEPMERNIVEMNKDVVSPMVASIEITNNHCIKEGIYE